MWYPALGFNASRPGEFFFLLFFVAEWAVEDDSTTDSCEFR